MPRAMLALLDAVLHVHDAAQRLGGVSHAPRALLQRIAAFCLAACSFPLYLIVRNVCATPNILLSRDWHPQADDGLDAESRRYLKHMLVLMWHLLGVAVVHVADGGGTPYHGVGPAL